MSFLDALAHAMRQDGFIVHNDGWGGTWTPEYDVLAKYGRLGQRIRMDSSLSVDQLLSLEWAFVPAAEMRERWAAERARLDVDAAALRVVLDAHDAARSPDPGPAQGVLL